MISVTYNNETLLINKQVLLKINYFQYMFEHDDLDKINVVHTVAFKYFDLLINFIQDNTMTTYLNYDVLLEMVKLASYFDYQYFIDNVAELPFDMNKVNSVNHVYQFYLYTNQIDKLYPHLNSFVVEDMDINTTPLLQYYDLMPSKLFKLFDCRPLLDYSPPLYFYHTYQSNMKYEYKNILTNDEFKDKFYQETNGLFENFKWDNICIAGGFLFGLLNQATKSMLDTSDIDLYIYHSEEEVRKQTWEYILSYFSDAQYYEDHGLITIKINGMKYPIQIIIMNYDHPSQILNSFDMNYCKLYYNGDMYADIGCLVAFKHQLAICDIKFVNTIDTRIYKTVKKGLRLMKNSDIERHATIIKNNCIMMDLYHLSLDKYQEPIKKENLIWYNYCHTMKLYSMKQGYNFIRDEKIKYKMEEKDDEMLYNHFLDKNIDALTIKEFTKMNMFTPCNYYVHNEPVRLFIKIGYEKIYGLHQRENSEGDFFINFMIKVDDETASIIQLYKDKFLGNTMLLKNNHIFIHIYDNIKTFRFLYKNLNKKMVLICEMIHKKSDINHNSLVKFVLSDIKLKY